MVQEQFSDPNIGIPTDELCLLWLMYFELVVISDSANSAFVCTQFCPEFKEISTMGTTGTQAGTVSQRFKGTFTSYHKKYNQKNLIQLKEISARKWVAFKPRPT
jgi:hypothetical protein